VIGGVDSRIGDETEAERAIFDFHAQTGNYFAVVQWEDGWTMNISTDDGVTWSKTYRLTASLGVRAMDLTVSGAWVYVGYVTDQISRQAKLRRFSPTDGGLDLDYSGLTVIDTSPQSIVDIAVETNVDSTDDRVFYSLVQNDGTTRFFWDLPTDGLTFSEVAISASNASGGLDMQWNPGFTSYSLFLSLIDQSDNLQVWRYNGTWSQSVSFSYSGSQGRTTISAFADRVGIAHDAASPNGQAIQYRTSQDGGDNWGTAGFVDVPTPGEGDFQDVDLTFRGGLGPAVSYTLDAGATASSYFRSKSTYSPGPWAPRLMFNDFESVAGQPTAINWTPQDKFGVTYVGGGEEIPYFDVLQPVAIFVDGVESGDTSAWSETTPNP